MNKFKIFLIKKVKIKIWVMFALLMTIAFSGLFSGSALADGEMSIVDNYGNVLEPSGVLDMKTDSITLYMKKDGNVYDDPRFKVKWEILDPSQDGVIASLAPTANKTAVNVHALSPGNVTITLSVTDSMDGDAVLESTTCNIRVLFSIDTTKDDSIYKYVNEGDLDRSLVLYSDSEPVQLALNFGAADSTNTQWMSANDEVAKVSKDGGLVTPVGAGRTQITATYTPSGTTDTYTAYLDVYIIPQVSKTDGSGYSKALNVSINSGESIYTDTVFTNNLEVIRSKIVWVVKQDDGAGNSKVIADSIGTESDLIKLNPVASRSNQLEISGRAGEYDLYFYTYGSYDAAVENGTTAYTPTVVHLTIKSDISDKDVILHVTNGVGDAYNFAEAFNMTNEEFKTCFAVSVTMSNGSSSAEYADYDSSNVTLTAKKTGSLKATLTVTDSSKVKKLLGLAVDETIPSAYTTNIDIVEGIYLDRSSLTISVGQTYQLNAIISGTYDEGITWSSSDESFVSVENGLIKGLKITTTDIIITATLGDGEGMYKKASCQVKVEAALDKSDVTVSPTSEQMLVGDSTTFVATIKKTVSVAPLVWHSTDEKVFTVKPSSDGKSAVVTAVGGGKATLSVYNSNNPEVTYADIPIEVLIPISSITFSSKEKSIPLYKEGYNIRKEVTANPTNATDSRLTWASSDSKVVTIDEDGYMTLHGAGTALVNVYPTYNPFNVMASCVVTVLGSPTDMTLDVTDVTMNVGEKKVVSVTYSPINTATTIEFEMTQGFTDLVVPTYDEERKLVTLEAKKPGDTNVRLGTPELLTANISVHVKQPSTDIKINPQKVEMLTGEKMSLTYTLNPNTSTDTVKWKSYNTSIATIDDKGNLTAVKSGTTFIGATAYNGVSAGPTNVIEVVVRDGVKSIALDNTEYTVYQGSSIVIKPIIQPETAYDKTVNWVVGNSSIAKAEASGISNCKITGQKVGHTLLIGTTADGGYSTSCVINVIPAPKANNTVVKVSPTSKKLALGKSFYITATVTGTSNKKVKWSTSKKKVCTVSKDGKVKGKKVGTAYIKATAKDGSGAYARCKVRVIRKVKKIKLNKYSAWVFVDKSIKLKAKVLPKNATIKKVKWTSSDKSIATVSSSGRVIGVAPGICRITATSTDGTKKKAMCLLRVREQVEATDVTVENSEITIAKGRSKQSGIKASPKNTTTSIKYHSDNKKVATVDKHGKIFTHRPGQATIYGTTANGLEGYCDVLVVDLNRKAVSLRQYDTEQLHVNEIDKGVTWYSRNINVATVDANGLVTGRRKGVTTIYAVVNGVKLGCRVTVKKIK